MKKLQMPSSYAALTAEEQQEVCGGGEFKDAVDNFFGNLHLDDFFYGGGLISFSISFVPMLLFRMVKLGIQTGISLYNQVVDVLDQILKTGSSSIDEVDRLRNQQQESQQSAQQQTNSIMLSSFPGLLK